MAASLLIGGSSVAFAQADLVIPAAAATDGAGGSRWASEVILHNAGVVEAPITLSFHDANGEVGQADAILGPRSTTVFQDVVGAIFGVGGTGAILIDTEDALAGKLAVTSRTYNRGRDDSVGEYGQGIPALRPSDKLSAGDTGVLTAPPAVSRTRFNAGLYTDEDTTILWRLIRNNGSVAMEVERTYTGGTHTQHNGAVRALFDVAAQNADVLHAVIQEGSAYIYGSSINNVTGDPTYVPAIRVRENLSVEILGVDLNENGTVDIFDADGNGVLDEPIELVTTSFPNYFRIVAIDPEGQELTYSLINASTDVQLIDEMGTIQWVPSSSLRGTSGSLTVRVSDGTDDSDLIIPVIFN
jgi:hypothetical protein